MSNRSYLAKLRASIFTKLMVIMLGMGVAIVVLVGLVINFMIRPLLVGVDHLMLRAAHDRIMVVLLVLLMVVVFVAHLLLRRALRPVRWLQEGVALLSEGNLDVVVPRLTWDEFGELTEAFNQMVGRVREMVRSRDQLLLDVSHELRSPLTRMKVALALCPDDEHNRRLSANVAEMEAMVTELLELERLRHGRGLQIEQHDLAELIRGAVATFCDRPPGVRLGSCPEHLLLPLDPEKVQVVFRNLLENAAKYSLPDSKPICVSAAKADTFITVTIQDDGPGIPTDLVPNLFEPFFRVDPSRSRKTGGYGLGLSLCKRIMQAHGGSVTIANNENRGATFVLSFPVTVHAPRGPIRKT